MSEWIAFDDRWGIGKASRDYRSMKSDLKKIMATIKSAGPRETLIRETLSDFVGRFS
jgi:hypothetical protein